MQRHPPLGEREPLLRPSRARHAIGPNAQQQQQHIQDRVLAFVARTDLEIHLDVFHDAIAHILHHQHDDSGAVIASSSNSNSSKWAQPWTLYLAVTATALGAVGQGWAQTSMNGANLDFPRALGLDNDAGASTRERLIVGLINSAMYLSNGLAGAWLATPLNHVLGRRLAVFIAAGVSLVSNLGSALAPTWPVLLAARLLLGCALGVISTTLNIYTAECAPAAIRGGLAVSWQFACAFGIFLGFVANVLLYGVGPSSWRLQLAASGFSMIPLLPLILWVPESPAWLIKHGGRYDLAFKSLCRLRTTKLEAACELYHSYQAQHETSADDDDDNDNDNFQADVQANNPRVASSSSASALQKFIQLITVPRIRHATLAAHTVMICQQLCGINIISFYSTTIFTAASFTPLAALTASCVFGLLNFLFAIPAVWTMDTLGRRSLLLYTIPLMALSMFVAGLSFRLPVTSSEIPKPPSTYSSSSSSSSSDSDSSALSVSEHGLMILTTEGSSSRFALLAAMIYLFCIVYSPGMGPVPAAYSAEVFPLSHREVGMSSAVAMTNLWAAALSASFPYLLGVMGSQAVFTMYSVLNVVAWGLVYVFVRETRLKTLDELDGVFEMSTGDFVRGEVCGVVDWVKGLWGKRT